ncbi:ubiquinone biosynthesis protein COQ6, mitochondrial isoform X2 [Brevipalpus obovatus]|uniref:ubiquinone biosynthesis protein COQ6, mitochondrial isoform X2 n=1 Tax=Brevipalpus obovatus TaxID=246614 RepID=UPI003D9E516F
MPTSHRIRWDRISREMKSVNIMTLLSMEEELINQDRKLSNRVSSITLASKRFLDKLEVWNSVQTFVKPISSMHVWSTNYSKGITFTPQRTSFVDNFIKNDGCTVDNQLHPSDSVCYVLENDILLSALVQNVDNSSIKFNTRLESISSDDSHIYLKTNDGHEMSTCLLIGSDGFDSFVRKVSNFNYQSIDLGQNGIVGTIQVSKQSDADLNDVAYQRFIPHMKSVLAILPLTDYHASIVLSVPRARTTAFMEMTDEAFVDTLNEALFYEKAGQQGSPFSFVIETFDNIIDRIVPQDKLQSSLPRVNPPQVLSVEEGSRATYPLHFGTTLPKLVSTIKGGGSKKIVLIGDAAHRIHPLAGQGLNLGLGDAEVLSRRLEKSLSNGEDIFSDHHSAREQLNQALFDMERQRLVKLIPMMAGIQTMQPLFSYLPGNTFRVFNQLSLLKNEVVRFANSV